MDYISIFEGVLSTEGKFADIYLNGVSQRRNFGSQNNDEHGFVQNITSLLTTQKTFALGLRLLDTFIENCSVDVLEKKGNLWTTLVLKACNNIHDDTIVFHVLNKIIKRSEKVPDLAKFFVSTHISKIYDCLAGLPSYKSKYALNCMETCLRMYPGSSVLSRGTVEKFLWGNIDHVDYEIVQNFGRCLHLLQQIKGGGEQYINHKTQWKNYQLQLIGGIHSAYNKMFANCVEMYEEEIEQEKLPWETHRIEFDLEPAQKAAQMYIRCRNLLTYLGIALREPFPVEKPILIKKLINVIIRGLSINSLMLERNPIADNIALSILLPELHTELLNLLNVAVTILRGHLRPYADLILCLMIEELKWTCGNHEGLWSLREKVYDVISLWCKTFKSSNLCESIAEYLFQNILRDISPTQDEFRLMILSGSQKHISKKVRRQLQNIKIWKSNVVNTHCIKSNRKQHFSENTNPNISIAALRCFQEVILSVANFLKPTILKIMQTTIPTISAIFYERIEKSWYMYYNKNCRIEIYKALYSFLITTHHLCPPPTELIWAIIQTAHVRDDSLEVRICCGFLLKNFEKVIHPQKGSLLFMIEARNIGNTFTKMCPKNVLIGVESSLQGSSSNYSKIADDEGAGLQVFTASSTSQNYNMGHDNETQQISISIHKNSNEIQNKYKSATNEVTTESLEDQAADVIEVRLMKHHLDGDTDTLSIEPHTVNENIKIFSKSSELLLCGEDDTPIARANKINNPNVNEPVKKKLKYCSECNETEEMENINANMDCDENYMLDEIASQFVDELE